MLDQCPGKPFDVRPAKLVMVLQYPLPSLITELPRLPGGFHDVGEQDGQLFLWAVVDPKQELVDVPIEVYGTGRDMARFIHGEIREHIKTVHMRDGLVWHVFQTKS